MIEWQKGLTKSCWGKFRNVGEDIVKSVYTFESGKHQLGGSGSSSSGR